MTKNHDDWVRGQEDFRINLEQLQKLQKSASNGDKNNIFSSELVSDVFSPHEPQKELAKLHENIRSLSSSFEIKSWETLTQKHRGGYGTRTGDAKIQEIRGPTHNECVEADQTEQRVKMTAGEKSP